MFLNFNLSCSAFIDAIILVSLKTDIFSHKYALNISQIKVLSWVLKKEKYRFIGYGSQITKIIVVKNLPNSCKKFPNFAQNLILIIPSMILEHFS